METNPEPTWGHPFDIPALGAESTAKTFSIDEASPFMAADFNLAGWLADDFPGSEACTGERIDLTQNLTNQELLDLMGGEEMVRKHHFTPQHIRWVSEQALKDDSIFIPGGWTNIFPVVNPKDNKIYFIGPRLPKGQTRLIPYIFNSEEISRGWNAGNRAFRIVTQ